MGVAEVRLGSVPRGVASRTHRFELWFATGALVSGVAYGMVPMLLPQFVAANGGSAKLVGMSMAVLSIGCLFAPLFGVLAERFHLHRPLTVFCAGTAAVALSTVAGSESPSTWMIGIAITGMCATGVTVITGLLVTDRSRRDDWPKRQGAAVMTYASGTAGGLLLAGAFAGEHARYGLQFGGMTLLVAAAMALLLLPWVPKKRNVELGSGDVIDFDGHPVMRKEPTADDGPSPVELPRWRTPLALYILGFGLLHLASSMLFFQYPLLAPELYELAPGPAAVVFGLAALAAVVWYPAVGRTARSREPIDVLTRASWMRALLFGELALLGMITVGWSALGAATLFFVYRNTWPSVYAGATEGSAAVVPARLQGLSMGALSITFGVSSLGAGILSGAVVTDHGYEALAPVACAIALAGGIVFAALRIWKRHLVNVATAWW